MHTGLLFAVAYYKSIHGPNSTSINLFAIKDLAMGALREGLEDPARRASDSMIMGVANVAIYEALFGDVQAYETHMRGVKQMVQVRGGLANLDKDGFLERLLLSIDANASFVTGTGLDFDGETWRPSTQHPTPNPRFQRRRLGR